MKKIVFALRGQRGSKVVQTSVRLEGGGEGETEHKLSGENVS